MNSKEEAEEELYRIYGKIASSWLELSQLVTFLKGEGEDVGRILKGKAKLKEALDLLLFDE